MESFSGDTEESTEDTEGRKKSKLKSLKSRLFGRSKKTAAARNAKLSQSASDITAGKSLGSDEDLACSQGTMGSRALSHDSIFLADQVLTDSEPAKVLSQENVQSKIKSLQMKLQQQKLRLGPPPLVPPIRHPDEPVRHLDTDCIPHSPTDTSGGDTTSQSDIGKTISPSSSSPLSTIPKPALTRSVPLVSSLPLPFVNSSSSPSSAVESPVDFSSPAHITSCLDNSAARHRMSIKPRNQRASTRKRLVATDSRAHSHTLNNINQPEDVKEDEQHTEAQDETTLETEQGQTDSPVLSQPSKYPEVAPTTPESAPKSPILTPHQDNPFSGTLPPVSSQVLQVKSHRAVDVRERPRSAFIESELKDKSEGGFETQLMSHDKSSAQIKTVKTDDSSEQPSFASLVAFRSSSFHKQEQGEIEGTKELKRPGQRSGSLHFSITTAKAKDGERPRSSSFVEPLEQPEARNKAIVKTDDKPFSGLKEKEEVKDLKPRGIFATGRLRQEGSPPKSSVLPWERRDSSKKIESVKTSNDVATDAGPEESDSNQEVVEEAVEAKEVQEEEGQTRTFGVKLRPTSQSMRFRPDASSNRQSKPPVCEEQGDKPKEQELGNNVSCTSKTLPTNISGTPSSPGDIRLTDGPPSGSSFPGKNNIPATGDPHPMPAEVERKSSNPRKVENPVAEPQEPPTPPQLAQQPASQTVTSEVSWMSLALEKTRNLHQLFSSKLPRDFSAMQTTLRPQARAQSANPTETQNGAQMEAQTVKKQPSATIVQTVNPPSTDTVKAELVQSATPSPTQSVRPAQTPVQQKAPTTTSGLSFREPQIAKQVFEPQSAPQSVSHPPVQTSPWTSQSPLHSLTQTETTSQSPQGPAIQPVAQSVVILGQHETLQQPPWSNRSVLRTNQFKPTTSVPATSSATTSSPLPTSGRGEREASTQEKEGSSQPTRRTMWGASVSERAAVLEKQAEWSSPSGTKGLELRKAPTDVQAPSETPGSVNTTAVSKDPKQDVREGVKPAESSPIKVPERTREDRWPRKNVASSSPSSSPIQQSALQSATESGQPSWMELAKRKSMAWNDRTMD